MKYIYVKKKDGSLKYKEYKDQPLLSMHILNIKVDDDFKFPEGSDIIFVPKKSLTSKELQSKRCIKSLNFGNFIAKVSKEETLNRLHNESIIQQLELFDKQVPRALEDIVEILKKNNDFDEHVLNTIASKKHLRQTLK